MAWNPDLDIQQMQSLEIVALDMETQERLFAKAWSPSARPHSQMLGLLTRVNVIGLSGSHQVCSHVAFVSFQVP